MHAYLIVGKNSGLDEARIIKILKELKLASLGASINKIDEVRNLSKFTKLSLNSGTAVIIKNIENASLEALNAFLKNLEEPQKNLYYILTCKTLGNIPSTIVSRCQIIRITQVSPDLDAKEFTKEFLQKSLSEKFLYVDSIKGRNEANEFSEKIILGTHLLLIESKDRYGNFAKILKSAQKLTSAIKANGNVQLQLTSFILAIT